jgi:hypothetical protein
MINGVKYLLKQKDKHRQSRKERFKYILNTINDRDISENLKKNFKHV